MEKDRRIRVMVIWAMLFGLGLRDPEWTYEKLEKVLLEVWSRNQIAVITFQISYHAYQFMFLGSKHVRLSINGGLRGQAIPAELNKLLEIITEGMEDEPATAEPMSA